MIRIPPERCGAALKVICSEGVPVCTESGTEEPEGEVPEDALLAEGTLALWDGAGEIGDSVCVPGDGTGDAGSKAGEAEGLLPVGAEKEGSGTGEAESVGNPVVEGAGEVVFSGAKETIGGSVGSV